MNRSPDPAAPGDAGVNAPANLAPVAAGANAQGNMVDANVPPVPPVAANPIPIVLNPADVLDLNADAGGRAFLELLNMANRLQPLLQLARERAPVNPPPAPVNPPPAPVNPPPAPANPPAHDIGYFAYSISQNRAPPPNGAPPPHGPPPLNATLPPNGTLPNGAPIVNGTAPFVAGQNVQGWAPAILGGRSVSVFQQGPVTAPASHNTDVQNIETVRAEVEALIIADATAVQLSPAFFGRFVTNQAPRALNRRRQTDRNFATIAAMALNGHPQQRNETTTTVLTELVLFFIIDELWRNLPEGEVLQMAADFRDGVLGSRAIYLKGHMERLRTSTQGKRQREDSNNQDPRCAHCGMSNHSTKNCKFNNNNRRGGGGGNGRRHQAKQAASGPRRK